MLVLNVVFVNLRADIKSALAYLDRQKEKDNRKPQYKPRLIPLPAVVTPVKPIPNRSNRPYVPAGVKPERKPFRPQVCARRTPGFYLAFVH